MPDHTRRFDPNAGVLSGPKHSGYMNRSEAQQLPLGKLPLFLQKAIKALLAHEAPAAFDLALSWLYSRQEKYISGSKTAVIEEMAGIVDGAWGSQLCNGTSLGHCVDKSKVLKTIHSVNMLPELIRMQCSMMGAWGPATPDGNLTQLRSLDFGAGAVLWPMFHWRSLWPVARGPWPVARGPWLCGSLPAVYSRSATA